MKSRSRPNRAVAALAVASLAAACATNPVTGKKELVLVSEAQEIQIGQAEAQRVNQEMGLYDDPELEAYVSEIGMRLAKSSERPDIPWRFHILDSPVVNAFALPGGPVYLTRGILAHMNSEAAMAGILGHEIGHITARHIVQQISRAQLANIGMGVGMIFVPEVRPYGDLIQTGLGVLFLKFSRDDERESDTLGVRYSLSAGYDAAEMASFFDVLRRLGEKSGQAIPSWMSTHPDPQDRQARILQQVQTSGPTGELALKQEDFLRRIEGMVFGENPRQGFMDGSRFKHPDLRFQLDFPQGWKVQNLPSTVMVAEPEGRAAIQLTATRVQEGTRPDAYGESFFRQHGLEYRTGERIRVSNFQAYRAPFRARISAGYVLGEAGFIRDGELMYEILAYTMQSSFDQYRRTFQRVIGSYDRLRDRDALNIQPQRIKLFRVPETMTLRQALARADVDEDLMLELALVNNAELDDSVEAGTLLKALEGRRPTGSRRR
jgi:predicted Zn-dependent protease